jgi:hypothetical protein
LVSRSHWNRSPCADLPSFKRGLGQHGIRFRHGWAIDIDAGRQHQSQEEDEAGANSTHQRTLCAFWRAAPLQLLDPQGHKTTHVSILYTALQSTH